jgi:hypothetical protein
MTPTDYATVAASIAATLAAIFAGLRFIVKAYLRELLPNSGKTLADRIMRIETRQNELMDLVVLALKSSSRRSTNATKKKATKTKRR